MCSSYRRMFPYIPKSRSHSAEISARGQMAARGISTEGYLEAGKLTAGMSQSRWAPAPAVSPAGTYQPDSVDAISTRLCGYSIGGFLGEFGGLSSLRSRPGTSRRGLRNRFASALIISARVSGGAPRRAKIQTADPQAAVIAVVVPTSIPVLNLPRSKEGVDGLTRDQMRTHAGKVTAQFVDRHKSTYVSRPARMPSRRRGRCP